MASASDDWDDWDDEVEYEPREVYEAVLRRLELNTGGYQPPLASKQTVRCSAIWSGGFPSDAVDKALKKARQNGDLFRWYHDAEERYYLGVDDPAALRERVTAYAQRRSEPRKDLIAVANQRIMALE